MMNKIIINDLSFEIVPQWTSCARPRLQFEQISERRISFSQMFEMTKCLLICLEKKLEKDRQIEWELKHGIKDFRLILFCGLAQTVCVCLCIYSKHVVACNHSDCTDSLNRSFYRNVFVTLFFFLPHFLNFISFDAYQMALKMMLLKKVKFYHNFATFQIFADMSSLHLLYRLVSSIILFSISHCVIIVDYYGTYLKWK